MEDQDKRLFLLDGMALAYRAYFALLRNPRLTSSGKNTSATFVCANLLLHLLEREEPTHMAAVFDAEGPTHRHETFADYKAHREEMPEDLAASLPDLFRLYEAFRVPVLRIPGVEADDVIGTLARRAEREGFLTYLVTSDKDFAQLVSDRILLYRPGRSGGEAEVLDKARVLDEWGIERPEQVIDVLGLMGDPSDNVPGVPGIGEKTAKRLIAQYGSVENLLDHVEELRGKLKENLIRYREQALLSKQLVTIHTEVPIPIEIEELRLRPLDEEAVKRLFVELEFRTLGRRLFGESFEAQVAQARQERLEAVHGAIRTMEEVAAEYRIVRTPEERAKLLEELLRRKAVCFDIETSGLNPRNSDIIGIAFSFHPRSGYYVPLPDDPEAAQALIEEFRPFLESNRIEKIGHNLKFDLTALRWRHGLRVSEPLFDTMVAAWLTMPEARRTMDALSERLLGYRPQSIESLIGKRGEGQRSLRDVPLEQVARYAAEDADVTWQLAEKFRPLLEKENQQRIFHEVECPLIPALVEMEFHGIRIDTRVLEEFSAQLEEMIQEVAGKIYEMAGTVFNLDSPKQLGEILFDKLQLVENPRRTRTGQYATNEAVLQDLAGLHPIVEEILRYRELRKLKSTYVDTLPHAVHPETGCIHTHFDATVASTGRLQSHNPNLQNIPIRRELGQEIRKAFVPRSEEYRLLSADYSQIELRIAAEITGDEAMREAFQNGEDIHTATAARVFGVRPEEVTPEMRSKAKTVNFGILYGISAYGLAQRIRISRTEAQELIDQYFRQFPGIRRYMEETIAFAREHGYVETLLGRRRYLRDINSRNATARAAAERNAINSRIQGTAADMIKIAMGRIHRRFVEEGFRSKMLLQIHDELLFDLHREEQETVPPIVEELMRTALPLSVPVVVELGIGENWLEAH